MKWSALLLAGCVSATWSAPPPDNYRDTLDVWTREGKAYTGFEHALTVKATLLSPMMQKAQGVPALDGKGMTFLVAVFTPNHAWNDLDSRHSLWRVTLESLEPMTGANRTFQPKSIVRVAVDQKLRAYYPHLSVFDVAYLIHFEADAPSETMVERLRIASSFAARSLDWTVDP